MSIEQAISSILTEEEADLSNVVLYSQGRLNLLPSYVEFVKDISLSAKLEPRQAVKLADSFSAQLAIFGFTRTGLKNVRVQIDSIDHTLPEEVTKKLETRLQSGSNVKDYNPKRICSFRAPVIKRYIEKMDEPEKINLVKKLNLQKQHIPFAFIGSEYAVKTPQEAKLVLEIARMLDNSEIKKDAKISQTDRIIRFFKASGIEILE